MPRPSQTRSSVREKADRSSIHFQKTKMCKFHLLGVCTRGTQCSWAHSSEELKALPDFYRTKLCHTYLSKGICRNMECRYAHGYHELRTTDGQEVMDNGSNSPSSINNDDICSPCDSMQQGYSAQWGASDVQFAFMQMIPFSPAMTMMDMAYDMPSLPKGDDCSRRDVGLMSRQTTTDHHGFGDFSNSEDGDLWVGSSDRSSGEVTPTRSASNGSPGLTVGELDDQADDVIVRVRNTFLEFRTEKDAFFQTIDSEQTALQRQRSRSLDTRIRA
jgi:hypothetical protein